MQIFRTQKYIEALTSKTKPKKILVCMIYYPDENNVPSWANAALGALGYNTNPAKIQLLIRKFFEEATKYVFFFSNFKPLYQLAKTIHCS